ncbi:hypothetical protein GGU11DRAFT_760664, partial [Lentinula aff. detonsa]
MAREFQDRVSGFWARDIALVKLHAYNWTIEFRRPSELIVVLRNCSLKSVARATGLTGYLDGTTVSPISSNAPPNPASSMSSTESTAIPVPTTVTSSTFTPINSRTPSAEEWELRDGRLAGIIYQNIKDPRSVGVNDSMSAHGMWTRLTSEHDTSSVVAQSLAKERIQQYWYNASTPFKEYFKQLEALRKAASDVGCCYDHAKSNSRGPVNCFP